MLLAQCCLTTGELQVSPRREGSAGPAVPRSFPRAPRLLRGTRGPRVSVLDPVY